MVSEYTFAATGRVYPAGRRPALVLTAGFVTPLLLLRQSIGDLCFGT